MDSNHSNSKNNSLWVGELDQSMDESYLKDSCKKYSNYLHFNREKSDNNSKESENDKSFEKGLIKTENNIKKTYKNRIVERNRYITNTNKLNKKYARQK